MVTHRPRVDLEFFRNEEDQFSSETKTRLIKLALISRCHEFDVEFANLSEVIVGSFVIVEDDCRGQKRFWTPSMANNRAKLENYGELY